MQSKVIIIFLSNRGANAKVFDKIDDNTFSFDADVTYSTFKVGETLSLNEIKLIAAINGYDLFMYKKNLHNNCIPDILIDEDNNHLVAI